MFKLKGFSDKVYMMQILKNNTCKQQNVKKELKYRFYFIYSTNSYYQNQSSHMPNCVLDKVLPNNLGISIYDPVPYGLQIAVSCLHLAFCKGNIYPILSPLNAPFLSIYKKFTQN